MPLYSHSQLSTYEECPLKYKLHYRDKIKRDVEGVEGFLGTMVHETLKKCYDDIRLTKLNTLDDLLAYYQKVWQQNWHDAILITRPELTPQHYQALGKKLIQSYYDRYAPFSSDITIATEMRLTFPLDAQGQYKLTGFIDRLARTEDDVCIIHDYKTSAHLPSQAELDHDRQLGLYQIGIQHKWPDIQSVRLVWHYLAFDREFVSARSDAAISKLVDDTTHLIDEIASAQDFPPRESALCRWCEYPDLCPTRKHLYKVAALPANEYLNEPGVALVNKYAELREKAGDTEKEIGKVREAIIDYARREQVEVIQGSNRKARVKFDKKLKFPAKNEAEREVLDSTLIEAGKWLEVSQLDATALTRIVESKQWDKALIDRVMQYGRLEETGSVYLSTAKNEEE